jgi:sirohydrochlorin cobaltochelatase
VLTGLILVAHGGIPKDFPREEMSSEAKLRSWPRNAQNDPYWAGVQKVAQEIRKQRPGTPFAVAFNEFCAPTLSEAAASLIEKGVQKVVILSTMIIPGGSHSEKDIPQSIEALKAEFSNCHFEYRWPYPINDLGAFFVGQLDT